MAGGERPQEPGAAGGHRVVLQEFPRVGFYNGKGNPEDYPLPSVVRAVVEYLRADPGMPAEAAQRGPWQWETCALVFGVTGQGVHFGWGNWGPQDVYYGRGLPGMYERAFRAAGLRCEALLKPHVAAGLDYAGGVSGDEAEYRRRVVESIRDRRAPVIALKLFGPAEPGVICGYERGGEVAIGYDHFQQFEEAKEDARVSLDEAGRFVKADWVRDVDGIIVVRGTQERPEPRALCQDALLLDLRHLVDPGTADKPLGFAAYAAWLEALLDDSVQGADEVVLKQYSERQHGLVGELAERRAYAATFVMHAARVLPEAAADLGHASECFDLMHDLCWRAWQTGGSSHIPGQDAPRHHARADVRRELAAIALLHRDLDARAARHLWRALRTLGVPEGDLPAVPVVLDRGGYAGVRPIPYFTADLDESVQSPALETHDCYRNGKLVRHADPGSGFGERVCSLARALETALGATARPVSYVDLMGHSGLAFRTRWSDSGAGAHPPSEPGRWHPVSPHGEQADVLQAIGRATGWRLRLEAFGRDDRLRREALTTDLVMSVYSGLPVLVGYNTDLGTAVGYHIWSMQYLLRHQQAQGEAPLRVGHQDQGVHGPFVFVSGYARPLSEPEAVAAGLRLAVCSGLQRDSADGFLYGLEALRAWRSALLDVGSLTADEGQLLHVANWWTLLHLWDARRTAVAYLEAHQHAVTGGGRQSLGAALDAYRREAGLVDGFLQTHRGHVTWWGGQQGAADWTAEERQAQAALMQQVIAVEEQALAALQRVAG